MPCSWAWSIAAPRAAQPPRSPSIGSARDRGKRLKLVKEDKFVILTEKEIQLLELLLKKDKPISKNIILSSVWNYSEDADTHTVETHIYRLRKKISDKFTDEKFILNNKDGYYL